MPGGGEIDARGREGRDDETLLDLVSADLGGEWKQGLMARGPSA